MLYLIIVSFLWTWGQWFQKSGFWEMSSISCCSFIFYFFLLSFSPATHWWVATHSLGTAVLGFWCCRYAYLGTYSYLQSFSVVQFQNSNCQWNVRRVFFRVSEIAEYWFKFSGMIWRGPYSTGLGVLAVNVVNQPQLWGLTTPFTPFVIKTIRCNSCSRAIFPHGAFMYC